MPRILTERYNSSNQLSYIKESGTRENGKNYIGRLEGYGANYNEPTRNGRKYTRELWERVQASEEFKEGMDTKTIFGEADHPETRADTSIKEIAVVLTDFKIQEDGNIFTGFDILDTPNGRIIKEVLDYGSILGVSSRGLGEEIMVNGENIIDPETYEFFAFDVVVTPAVKSARPHVVESVETSKKSSLTESIIREINDATCSAEIESIVRIAESAKVPDLDSIKESVDNRLNSIVEGNNIAPQLQNDLEVITKENVSLKEQLSKLESRKSSDNIRIGKMKDLIESTKSNSNKLSKHLQKSKLQVMNLESSLLESANENEKLIGFKENLESRLEVQKKLNAKLQDDNRSLAEQLKLAKEQIASLNEKLSTVSESNEKLVKENSSLRRSNGNLKVQINESIESSKSKLLDESRKAEASNKVLTEKYNSMVKYAQKATLEYLKTKCKMYNLDASVVRSKLPNNYTVEDIENTVTKLAQNQDRINKLPVNISNAGLVFESVELSSRQVSAEDKQTMSILESTQKSK